MAPKTVTLELQDQEVFQLSLACGVSIAMLKGQPGNEHPIGVLLNLQTKLLKLSRDFDYPPEDYDS